MTREVLYNEIELFDRIAQGDEAAFAKLFEHYRDRIYTIAFKFTKSSVIAEEIVQDIFLKIWTRRASLTAIRQIDAYLFVVTRNSVYKVLRAIAQNPRTAPLETDEVALSADNAESPLLEKEYDSLLRHAIDRLPAQQKQVYQMVKDGGLRREEVAHRLQIQPETVKFHLAQARKNIRAFCLLRLGADTGFLLLLLRLFKNI